MEFFRDNTMLMVIIITLLSALASFILSIIKDKTITVIQTNRQRKRLRGRH